MGKKTKRATASAPRGRAADEVLDLTGLRCPENSMRATLRLDAMEPGQVLLLICDDGDTLTTMVPNLTAEGYEVMERSRQADGRWHVKVVALG